MKFITVKSHTYGLKIHQRDSSLPDLLMLHGFMGDHRAFDHLAEKLSAFCNPLALDLLGHGKSSKPVDPRQYHQQQQIDGLLQLIDKLGNHPIFLYGYSMGGRLALQTVLQASQRFKGLILESTTCGIPDPDRRKERQKLDAGWAADIKNDFPAFLSKWKELDLFTSPVPVDESLNQRYQNIQSEQAPSALAASLHGFGTGSMMPVCDKLRQFNSPVLLLAGTEDEKYQQLSEYLVDQFPNATFSSIEAGHRTHLDNPTKFIETIKQFFNRLI